HAGRGKAGEIADHAAAERDHQIAAVDARVDDRLAHGLEDRITLGAFARRHLDRRTADAGGFERGFRRGQMLRADIDVGDDNDARARAQRLDALPERSEQRATDDDVVVAARKCDGHDDRLGRTRLNGHASPSATMPSWAGSAAMISSTMASCGSSRDSTTMLACE